MQANHSQTPSTTNANLVRLFLHCYKAFWPGLWLGNLLPPSSKSSWTKCNAAFSQLVRNYKDVNSVMLNYCSRQTAVGFPERILWKKSKNLSKYPKVLSKKFFEIREKVWWRSVPFLNLNVLPVSSVHLLTDQFPTEAMILSILRALIPPEN